MTAWADVHVGDVVRGADQRPWTVSGRDAPLTWLGKGVSEARFELRLGERTVSTTRRLHDPVDMAHRGDHAETGAAWGALATHFPTLTLLEETLSTDPFTSPVMAVKRDSFGRYRLPDPKTGEERSWTRVTTVARTLADEYHLNRWKMRMVAKGLALRPDLIAGAAAADPEEDKRTLNEIAEKAMERAEASAGSTRGTALHNFTKRLDRGEPLNSLGAPPPLDADLAEYVDTLKRHHLGTRPEAVERIVVLPDLGIAGQLDRIVHQSSGVTKSKQLSILDLKTGKDLQYGWLEIAIQQAMYANAPLIWNPATQKYEPMPADIDKDRALVLHLPAGKAHGQVYGVNLIEGWTYTQLALKVREARSGARGLAWLVEPSPDELALHNVCRAASREELAQLWDLLYPKGLWTEEVSTAATARMTELSPTTALATTS